MKRQDYIKLHALELKKLCDKRDRLNAFCLCADFPVKKAAKISADLNFVNMHISMENERLAFALGYLQPKEALREYCVCGFQRYAGIQDELAATKFD